MASIRDLLSLLLCSGAFAVYDERQARLQGVDAGVLIDALADVMGHEEKELCKAGAFAMRRNT